MSDPHRYRGACGVEKLDPINYLRPSKWACEKDGHVPLVCDLKEKAALIETLVGGKGLSLALLQSMQDTRVGCESCARSGGKDSYARISQFQVPAGFCVTTEAFTRQTQTYPLLESAIISLNEVATGQKDLELKTACEMYV
jgi:hypothetical protein